MNKFTTAIKSTMNQVVFKTKKHSPEILMVAGVTGVVASTVLACKSTMKIGDVLEEQQTVLDKIHFAIEHPEQCKEEYTEEDAQKDTVICYTQTAIKLVRLYAPAALLSTASIACLIGSHNILRKRYLAMSAAYTAIDKSFKEYRGRVTERFGEEVEKEIRYDLKTEEVEEKTVNAKGKEKVTKKKVQTTGVDGHSEYSRYFDKNSAYFSGDRDYDLMFLKAQMAHANDLLIINKRLFLNDVYKMLDLEPSQAGQIVGWTYDPDNKDIDSYIDFNILETNRHAEDGSLEECIVLDFNVDGNVWSDMPNK